MNPNIFLNVLEQVVKHVFAGCAALKSDFYRHHNSTPTVTQDVTLTPLKCTVSLCEHQCEGRKPLVAHLKEHIAEGRQVACPVRECKSAFTAKTSVTSHVSRKHRQWSENMIYALISDTHCDSPTTSATIQEPASVSDAEGTVRDGCNFSDLYLRNFFLRLLEIVASDTWIQSAGPQR